MIFVLVIHVCETKSQLHGTCRQESVYKTMSLWKFSLTVWNAEDDTFVIDVVITFLRQTLLLTSIYFKSSCLYCQNKMGYCLYVHVFISWFPRIIAPCPRILPLLSCLFCLVLACLVLSCLGLSCLVLSCLVLSCRCLGLSCLVLSCLVLPCLKG